MEKDVLNWKNKGQYLDYQGHQIFYFQEGAGENLLILHGYPYSSLRFFTLKKASDIGPCSKIKKAFWRLFINSF